MDGLTVIYKTIAKFIVHSIVYPLLPIIIFVCNSFINIVSNDFGHMSLDCKNANGFIY